MPDDWGQLNVTYQIKERTEYFDNYKYLARVKRSYPNWNWPGVNNGNYRPLLTQPDEVLENLIPGTKFTITRILYQARSWVDGANKMLQAVEATVDNSNGQYTQSNLAKTGFIWIWHFDRKFYEDVPQQQPQPQPQPEEERIDVIIDEDKRKNGVKELEGKKRKLIFPVFTIRIKKSDIFPPSTQTQTQTRGTRSLPSDSLAKKKLNKNEAVLKLKGVDNNGIQKYAQMIKIKDAYDTSGQDNYVHVKFVGMPIGDDIKYTLRVDPGKDEQGNIRAEYVEFEGIKYSDKMVR